MTLRATWLLPLLLASGAVAQGKDLLFYGNSYTFYSWGFGVPELVGQIATEAGHPTPNIVQALIGGSDLQIHATDPAQVAVIGNSLPVGEQWDHVVIQARSVEPTEHFGYNSADFRMHAAMIAGNVRAHSPSAQAVMYQTWARAWGHMYYPSPWATPMEMHDELRTNNGLAVADINAAFGPGAATLAAVGDTMALLEWEPSWYENDGSHPSPAMILMAAMGIYTSIYGQTICAVDPGFATSSPLAQALTNKGVGEATWNLLAGLSDRSAAAATRRFAGSGDHLLLESAVDSAPLGSCPTRSITAGSLVSLRLGSKNGVYDGAPGVLLVDFFLTGAHQGPWAAFPEVQVELASTLISPILALTSPFAVTFPMPFTLPGGSFLVQGMALQASGETGNPSFTTTDGHELVFF